MSIATASNRYLREFSSQRQSLKLKWWREIILIAVFYAIYTFIRNQFGSGTVSPQTAFNNADLLIDFEKLFGLYQEARIQGWFIDHRTFIQFWNIFYGFCHFAVTILSFCWLYIRFPLDFIKYRTIGFVTTALGLIGFAAFPVMPPRLLEDAGEFGGLELGGGETGAVFVDTLKEYGGLWSFDSGAVAEISNQYAAMPSIHIAWAIWCAWAIYAHVQNPIVKTLAVLYPVATLFAIVVTANHYWIDALGGAGALLAGYFLVNFVSKTIKKYRQDRLEAKQALQSIN